MRKKKMILIFFIVIAGILFFSGSGFAGKLNYICNVDQVGTKGDTQTRVMLTDQLGAFTQKWFLCTRKKEMLAILLTAIATNMQVEVRTDINDGTYPEIVNLYIIAP